MLSSLKEDFFWPNLISTWTASTPVCGHQQDALISLFLVHPHSSARALPCPKWRVAFLPAVCSKAGPQGSVLQGNVYPPVTGQMPTSSPMSSDSQTKLILTAPGESSTWIPVSWVCVRWWGNLYWPLKTLYLSDTFQQESFKYSPCFYGWSVEKHLRIQGLLPNNNKNSNESSSSSSLSSLMLMGHVAWTTLLCSGTVSACTR